MRKQLSTALIALLTFMSSAFADNEIYIDQTGSSATININQDGTGNRVGASGDISTSDGSSTTMDIDQVGASNVLDYDVYGANANITSNTQGSSSDIGINVGTTSGSNGGSDDVD